MKNEPMVITLNIRINGLEEHPELATEFAERLMETMRGPVEAEQDAGQWVGLPIELFGPEVRVFLNGERWQFRNLSEAKWTDGSGIAPKGVIAYRKGREVALAEDAALREQVEALLDAILNPTPRPASFPEWPMEVGSMRTYPTLEDWHRIEAAAEAVKL